MAGNFQELLKKANAEKREKAGLEPLPEEDPFLEVVETAENKQETQADETTAEETDVPADASRHAKHTKNKKVGGCLRGVIWMIIILAFCGTVSYFVVAGVLDFSALNKSDKRFDVVIPNGASTEEIAAILEENGLIDQKLIFRLYSRFTKRDGRYQSGTYSLSADMGYEKLADIIIAGKPRETVTVTIPEGFTIDDIAKALAENNVCTTADFYDALLNGTYDYDFFADIPQASDGGVYEGRIYRLEGYLFPDTYEFYTESSGKTVVEKFLSNFDSKFTTAMKSAMQAQGLTLDEVVIMASIAEKEAATDEDMSKVTKVLYNRLDSDYTRLECDSTALYVKDLMSNISGADVINQAYDTYSRSGLPAGAICNPGFAALQAAVYPSTDSYISQCYYFANDTKGNTYYSKTFAEHEAACRKHGIGMYG